MQLRAAFGFVGRDLRMTDTCRPVQPSIKTAFEAEPPSSPVQPDASKWKVLAVSLLYTEVARREAPPPALLSVREVARRLGVSCGTVYSLCETGQLAFTRVVNAIRVAEGDLEEFIHARRRS
jgi:excisionase family DNA binding protein